MREELRTTCTRDCPDSCSVIVTVEDGRVVGHRGDPNHPITRGFLCSQGNDYLKHFYHPQRLLYPQRRTSGGWQRISWDEALDLTAEKLAYYRDAFGPRSILVVSYSAITTWVARVLGRLFWAHFGGGTFTSGGLSLETSWAAQNLDFGDMCCHEPEDFANSAAFVAWGRNVAVTRQHWMPFINETRHKGAPLVVIDPVYNAMARRADRFYQLRPGSDGMLAIGIARLLIERNTVDWEFIANHSSGFEDYRALVLSVPLDKVVAATDLSIGQIGELADLYATKKPVATFIGQGVSYWTNSGATARLIDALVALSGNVGVPGGGASTDTAAPGLNLAMLREAPRGQSRRILLPKLGDEIVAAQDPPIKMGWVAGTNPAASVPNTNRVKEGLRTLEFLVVVDQVMSATAELADLILPCCTYMEVDDLVTAYGHAWLGLANRVAPQQGEAKSDAEIMQLLAQRLGFGGALAGDPAVWMQRLLQPVAAAGVTVETLREGAQRNPNIAAVPFADRHFATPSGKFEFVGAFEPRTPGDGLNLIATKTPRMINSQVLPEDLPQVPVVRVHPAVLADLGLGDDDAVWVTSRVGEVRARLAADETVRRDVLLFNPARWQGDLNGVNQLREALLTDMDSAAAMHETMVTLRRAHF